MPQGNAILAECTKLDRAWLVSQRMVWPGDHADRLPLMRVRADFRVGSRVEDQADVRFVFHHLTDHFVTAADVHDQFDSGVLLGKPRQRLRQTFKKTFPGHQRHRAAVQAFQRLNRIQQHFLLSQPLAVVSQHLVTRFGRFDTAPVVPTGRSGRLTAEGATLRKSAAARTLPRRTASKKYRMRRSCTRLMGGFQCCAKGNINSISGLLLRGESAVHTRLISTSQGARGCGQPC